MKSVLFSINKPYTDYINLKVKISELRTKPPKIEGPYKAYIYETLKYGGCGKVIGEFTAFNENTYRVCMGVPIHLLLSGFISLADLLRYTDNGKKDITEISITDLVIYDEPKELNEFTTECKGGCDIPYLYSPPCDKCGKNKLTRPPQNWCYVER